MGLLEFLGEYGKSTLPMHMPGHKRNALLAPYLARLCASCDVTEAEGLDDLHDARGILRAGMEQTAALWGSRRAFWLVNGSTCGILAGVWALLPPGGKAIVQRNSHKSVYNALSLRRARAEYLLPGEDGTVEPAQVAAALERHPDARLLILTSPTYEGFVSDLPAICALAHARGVAVLVDEAHGAHLGFGYGFPEGAVKAGADIVVHSLHKTLPSLTQTAVLHIGGALADGDAVARALAVFETSSPSYLLMASIEGCVSLIESRGDELFAAWADALSGFYERAAGLQRLALAGGGFLRDPSKIAVLTERAGMTGAELADRLRKEHRIEVEMAAAGHVVAMSGMGDTRETLSRFADALLSVDRQALGTVEAPRGGALNEFPAGTWRARSVCQGQTESLSDRDFLIDQKIAPPALQTSRAWEPWETEGMPWETVRMENAVNCICAETIWAYPPGIPLVLPGELLSREMLALIEAYRAAGVRMNGVPGEIRVLTK